MKKIVLLLLISISFLSCEKEFEDHNNITEEVAFKTPQAYKGIVLGMTKEFATNSLYRIIHAPALTANEMANMSTYETESQLVDGGPELTGVNSSLSSMWRNLHRNRGIAEKILANIDNLEFPSNADRDAFNVEKAAYKAYAYMFKAMTTGYLAHYWEKVTIENDINNNAQFVSREQGYQKAIDFLDKALVELNADPGAEDYINTLVSYEFSIVDVIHALKARYEIELGNYQEAYDAANSVDLTKRSVWSYDGGSILNPLYRYTLKPGAKKRFRPIDFLGLTNNQLPETNDQRVPFYLTTTSETATNCNLDVDDPNGFWASGTSGIPVYLPDEMKLIKAEAKARMGGAANLAEAVSLIDEVRTQAPANDVFGVGGGLAAWTGNVTNQQEVLDEIYKNYAIELFLEGLRFPIHRRFYPNYLDNVDWNNVDRCSLERLNNFYPYPDQERANNPNCPDDPAY
jgi:hypothetical protein